MTNKLLKVSGNTEELITKRNYIDYQCYMFLEKHHATLAKALDFDPDEKDEMYRLLSERAWVNDAFINSVANQNP